MSGVLVMGFYDTNHYTLGDKLQQAVVFLSMVGTFAIVYHRDNSYVIANNNEIPKRPTIEAILNKEEELFKMAPSIMPGDKNRTNGSGGKVAINSYNGKRCV
jgi:hypothetical protein